MRLRAPFMYHTQCTILYGSVGVECKNNDVRSTDVVPPLIRVTKMVARAMPGASVHNGQRDRVSVLRTDGSLHCST